MSNTLNTRDLHERLKNLLEMEALESDAIQDIFNAKNRLTTSDSEETKQQAIEDIQCAEHALESISLSLEDNIELDELVAMEAVVSDFESGADLILESESDSVNLERFGKISYRGETYLYELKQSS